MATADITGVIPPEILADMEEAARRALSHVRDPEKMREACARMDRTRAEIQQQHGLLDIAVPAIRELRDSE